MANITATSVADAIPEFWAQKAIGYLSANLVMALLVNRDVEDQVQVQGDTVNVIKRGALTVRDKVANTAVVSDAPANSKVPVTLSKHKYVAWYLEDNAGAKAIEDAINYVKDGMMGIAEAIETDLLALHASIANEVGVGGTDIGAATLLAARKQLNIQKCPMLGRNLIVSPKDEVALLALDKFTAADARGDNGQALTEAKLGRIYGLDCYMSQLVDVVAGTPDVTHNLAFHGDAFTLAMRPLALPAAGSGAIGAYVSDPQTGLALRYTRQWDSGQLATKHVIDVLYGVAAIDEDRLAVDVLG